MFHFFYDSLDTLKKLKKPTKKEVVNITITIFVVVIISAFIFAILDTLAGNLYQSFYGFMMQ